MKNKLIIAGAGTGKTSYLISEALKTDEKSLITTFTINCKNEIIDKIIKEKGYIPQNVNVQTWFSLLLQHGIKPYKRAVKIDKVKGVYMATGRSGIRFIGKIGPVYWSEENFEKFYFDSNNNIYTDKLSKLVIRIDEETKGKVINRLASIYKNIFIDEVQDMAGYDLEFIKRLMTSSSDIVLVGDPRQTVYKTHYEQKYKKYSDGNIENFIKEECKKIECDIDNTTLNKCYRCHKDIIDFVNNFYNDYTAMESTDIEEKEHQGVFVIKQNQVEEYIKKYNPVQVVYDAKTTTSKLSQTITMGKSKGATYNRVLLYPTGEFKNYITKGKARINIGTKNKLYVGMTRPINSLTFVLDNTYNFFRIKKWFRRGVEMIQGILNYKEIQFEFILDKDNLQLRPKENFDKKFIECFRQEFGDGAYTYKNNYLEDEFLIGQRLENYQNVIFIPESKYINTNLFTDFLYIRVKHVIYINRIEPISRISICCKELNAIYDIRKSIEKRGFNKNGEAELKLKSFEQTEAEKFDFTFKDKKIECGFNISKTLYGKITEFPVRIRSEISLDFESTNNYMLVADLYDIVKKFIQFLCYRENVTMEEIKIYSKDEKYKYRQIGTFETRCNEISKEDDIIIENRYISYDYIKNSEKNIFQSISNQDLYMRHFPLTYKDGKKENESTFIMTTAAFEWEFKKLYPKGIPHSKETKEAQEKITEKINELKENSTGKKKKIYKNLLKFIDLEGFAENLEYTCNDLNDIIYPFGDMLYKINNEKLDYKEMGARLSEQRNHFAHGDIDQEFIGLALLDLIFLKEIVYAMQLKRFGVTDRNIKKSLNELFNAGLQL